MIPTPYAGPLIMGQMSRIRPFTWFLMFVLSLAAVLAAQLRRPEPQLLHVSGPPAVEAPAGPLAAAFDLAREGTVRIEARCAGPHGGPTIGIGSGFFVTEEGLLLTAYHVVDATRPQPCEVRLVAVTTTEEEYDLRLVGFDVYMDVAALQADVDRAVAAIPLASETPHPGDPIVAIGNSRGDFIAGRAGRVTRLGVEAGRADFASGTMELTASLAPGDSGGPVINARGEAVGVVSYISFNPGAMSSQGWIPPYLRGIALPSTYASYAVPVIAQSQLLAAVFAGERRDVPVIGFSWRQGTGDYDPGTSPYFMGRRPGTIVDQVAVGGPADMAGLRSLSNERVVGPDGSVTLVPEGDVIVAIDGEPTPRFYELLAIVREKLIGETVTLTVQRGNATFDIELTLGARSDVFAGP